MSTTLPPAILNDERDNCGIGVLEKVREALATVLGSSRLVTGGRSSSGDVALVRGERRTRRKEVGGLIWSGDGFSAEVRGGAVVEGRVVFYRVMTFRARELR